MPPAPEKKPRKQSIAADDIIRQAPNEMERETTRGRVTSTRLERRVWVALAPLILLLALWVWKPREAPPSTPPTTRLGSPNTMPPIAAAALKIATPCVSSPAPHLDSRQASEHPLLEGFRGDTRWIHNREGHVGAPYWPRGISGVTLDPGVDLGQVSPWFVEVAYSQRLSRRQRKAIDQVMGIRGERADLLLRRNAALRSIRISRAQAADVFPHLLLPYWRELHERFPIIDSASVPPQVQTALLSLAYNRGPWNPSLALLRGPLEEGDWAAVSRTIRAMQQDHPLEGIRRRRRFESLLIAQHLSNRPADQPCPATRSLRKDDHGS